MSYDRIEAFRCPCCEELTDLAEGQVCEICGKLVCFGCINTYENEEQDNSIEACDKCQEITYD